jgi:hypothetical protein
MNVKEYEAFKLAWDALDYCKFLMDRLEGVTFSTDGYNDTVRALEAVTSLIKDYEESARLRKAAQELLGSLRYMVVNAETDGWSELMLSDAKAAIAKAEGVSDEIL